MGLKNILQSSGPPCLLASALVGLFRLFTGIFFLIQFFGLPRSLHTVQVASEQKPLLLPTQVGGSGRLLVTKHKHSIQVHEPHDFPAQPHWPRRWVARK
jgi:hypothetical protein